MPLLRKVAQGIFQGQTLFAGTQDIFALGRSVNFCGHFALRRELVRDPFGNGALKFVDCSSHVFCGFFYRIRTGSVYNRFGSNSRV